jgi:hypothetical protein
MMDDEEEEKDRRVADSRRQQSIFFGIYVSERSIYSTTSREDWNELKRRCQKPKRASSK